MTIQGCISVKGQTDVDGSVRGEQLLLAIEKALLITGYAGTLRGIQVDVHADSVVLSGRLPSYYLKQIAQVSAMKVDGVVQVRNEIQVD